MLIAASVLALLLAVAAYRRSPWAGGYWWLLAPRLLALAGVLVVLSGSVLEWRWRTKSRRVVVLADLSQSVAAVHSDSAVARAASALPLPGNLRREQWWFGDTVVRGSGAHLPADRRMRTDLGLALRQAGRSRPGAIVLLTDGQDNGSTDAIADARSTHTPVWVIGFGGRSERNLAIERVVVPSRVYAGESITVSARLSVVTDLDETVGVTLGAIRREFPAVAGGFQIDCEFPVVFERAGFTTIAVTADSLRGEVDLSDNVHSQSLEVLPSRYSIVTVVGVPGPTSRFVLAGLRDDGRFDLRSLSSGGSDTSWLRRADVVVLADVSEVGCSPAVLAAIEGRARSRLGVLLVGGPATQIGPRLGDILGISGGRAAAGRFVPRLSRSGRLVPWLDGFGMGGTAHAPLEGVLQFQYERGEWQTWLEAERTGEQLLVRGRNGDVEMLVLAGYPVWRWSVGADIGRERSPLTELVVGAARHLAESDVPPLQLRPGAGTYYAGEPVILRMTAVVPGGGAWSGLSVALELRNGDSVIQTGIPMTQIGPGAYEVEVPTLSAGRYGATAVAMSESVVVGQSAAVFAVSDRTVEMARVGLNEPVLRSIAAVTGGRYMPAESAVSGWLPVEVATHVAKVSLDFRHMVLTYILIAFIASIEWLARRRQGLL